MQLIFVKSFAQLHEKHQNDSNLCGLHFFLCYSTLHFTVIQLAKLQDLHRSNR